MAKKSGAAAADVSGKIAIMKDGPYIVSGGLPLAKEISVPDKDGVPIKWEHGESFPKQETYALCRCGASVSKPYCSGKHTEIGFDGTETADRAPYTKKAEKIDGGTLDMTDCQELCSAARFCDRAAGAWKLTEDSKDPEARKMAIEEACNCPSGRLVIWDKKTKKAIEPKLEKSVGLIEDPAAKASGPIWIKGGVPVLSSDGKEYEVRNRVTLCRCGKSGNKPFCDGTHIEIGFNDGDKRVK